MGLLLYASQICQAYGTEADSQSCMQIAGYNYWKMELNIRKIEKSCHTFELLTKREQIFLYTNLLGLIRGKKV